MNKRKQEKKERNKQDKIWREKIKQRDKVCVICGKEDQKGKGKGLNVHHIIPKEIDELRQDEFNGILLCSSHHRYNREISAHQNAFAFYLWLQENRPKQFKYLKSKWNTLKIGKL